MIQMGHMIIQWPLCCVPVFRGFNYNDVINISYQDIGHMVIGWPLCSVSVFSGSCNDVINI